jgi:hypothetical protein
MGGGGLSLRTTSSLSSVVDWHRVDDYPDPNFHDPEPNFHDDACRSRSGSGLVSK